MALALGRVALFLCRGNSPLLWSSLSLLVMGEIAGLIQFFYRAHLSPPTQCHLDGRIVWLFLESTLLPRRLSYALIQYK